MSFFIINKYVMGNKNSTQFVDGNWILKIGSSTDLQTTEFFIVEADTPSVSVTPIIGNFRGQEAKIPGEVLRYDDLNVTFSLDSNLYGYKEILDWMKANKAEDGSQTSHDYKDVRLLMFDGYKQNVATIVYKNAFPINLGGISLSQRNTESTYPTTNATFSYESFYIEN